MTPTKELVKENSKPGAGEARSIGSLQFTPRKILTWLAMAAIALVGLFVIAAASNPAAKDYISYWSAAKLLFHHGDPYSPVAVLAMERAHGFLPNRPIIMRNPPWAMFLVVPLAIGKPMIGLLFWLLAAVACILIFARLFKVPSKDRALAFMFAPAFACITSGQSSPFLLLGFCLFLYLHQRFPFIAGASLLLMAIKPHLFLVFWAVLLAQCIYRRRFRILAGLSAALIASSAFAMALDWRIWSQYFAMLRVSRLEHEFFPTVSMLLRLLINPNADWILFLPSVLAVAWGIWYFVHHRRQWDWNIHGMLLMLVTILASPYGWFTDQIVLIPSIAFALISLNKRKYSVSLLLLANSIALILLFRPHVSLTSWTFLWTPVAWLAWFLYATYGFEDHNLRVRPTASEGTQFV